MNKACLWIAAFALLGTPLSSFADTQFKCNAGAAENSVLFAELQKEARLLNEAFCSVLLAPASDTLPRDRLRAFAAKARSVAVSKFAGTPIDQLEMQFANFESQVNDGDIHPLSMPRFILQRPIRPSKPYRYFFTGDQESGAGVLDTNVDSQCSQKLGKSCSEALEDLSAAIQPYQVNYNAFAAERTVAMLDKLSARWDRYFDDGRTLTSLDLVVTTILENKSIKQGHLVGPPPRQWFFLHPEAVVEYVPDAPDGEQLEVGLAIEVIGINWWERSLIGIPFGASLTTTYSDRSDIDDAGYGITLFFDNIYSVGWAKHGGKDGFYVSMDLLTLFKDKKSQIEKYRNAVRFE